MSQEKNNQNNPETEKPASEIQEVEFLRTKISELEGSLAQMKDQLLRKAAEFENYKKRIENDYSMTVRFANEDLISSLLPALDDFYRSIKISKEKFNSTANSAGNEDLFLKGMELIYSKLMKILEGQDVRQFDSLGKPFDPYYHDALMQIPKHNTIPNTVIEEVEKGYMLHDRVIRHARVIVSSEPKAEEPASSVVTPSRPSDSRNGMVTE